MSPVKDQPTKPTFRRWQGVSARLTVGLAGLLLITGLCAGIAVYSLNAMVAEVDRLTGGTFRQVVAAEHLAQRAQVVAGVSPKLLAARDDFELDNLGDQIADMLDLLDRGVSELEAVGISPARYQDVASQRDGLHIQVEDLIKLIRARVATDAELLTAQQQIFALIEKGGTPRSGGSGGIADLTAILYQASLATDPVQIVRAETRSAAVLGRLSSHGDPRSTKDVTRLMSGDTSIFSLRRRQIDLFQRLQGATVATNLRANQFVYTVSNVVSELRNAADTERQVRRREVYRISAQLTGVAGLAALIAFTLVVYLHKSVLRRLVDLRDSVYLNTIGCRVPIPESGTDEIGDVAGSVRHFIEELQLREGELMQLQTAVENSTASIMITDCDGIIRYVNPAFTWITGYDRAEVMGLTPALLKSGETPPEVYLDLWTSLLAGRRWRGTLLNRRKDGTVYWEQMSAAPIVTTDGQISHFVAVRDDITTQKAMEDELRRLATTDALTGLANRRTFIERSESAIARCRRYGHAACMLMIDFDHFKQINDTWGHGVGDEVLRSFAAVSGEMFRIIDIVGRLGGEEFAALVPETTLAGALIAAERLRTAVQAHPVLQENGSPLFFTISIGVAVLKDTDVTTEQLLGRADLALYAAKRNGRNRVCAEAEGVPVGELID